MQIDGKHWTTIWLCDDGISVGVIDQSKLPHQFSTKILRSCNDACKAISNMVVRGAPLIGVTAAYGLMLAVQEDPSDKSIEEASNQLFHSRPTAINLAWAIERVSKKLSLVDKSQRAYIAKKEAGLIAEEDISICKAIGHHGYQLFEEIASSRGPERVMEPLRVLTHCNAGWLATVDWGTALAPIYKWHRNGRKVHVWVDETRPRNQGASLTAFELASEGITHKVVVDNAGGYLMQKGMVDIVIVGTDRTTSCGDVCNKIGTYLKALAAKDNKIPFYVALPYSSIDWSIKDSSLIPIEIRSEKEVAYIEGKSISQNSKGNSSVVRLIPEESQSYNPGFDITPVRLVSGFITEKGFVQPGGGFSEKLFSI